MRLKAGLQDKIWQYFAALPDIKSVGVTDGKRTYNYTIALRAVNSIDGMTAEWAKYHWKYWRKFQIG